jgi:NAD/NADP transhydrogenase beta subunit
MVAILIEVLLGYLTFTGSIMAAGKLQEVKWVPQRPVTYPFQNVANLLLFVVAATASAFRKPITQGFDEVAHISYVAHLQTDGAKWPGFSEMRMIDPVTFRFDSEPSYLNHPPFYYWLIAALGPHVLQQPASLAVDRLLNVALVAMGLVALLVLAQRMKLDRTEFYAFAVMIAATPVLASLAGSVNNDNLDGTQDRRP